MVNLAGLSAVSPGYMGGQDALMNIKLKAQQLASNQLALDQQKRDLQALAAIVAQAPQGGQPQAGQPQAGQPPSASPQVAPQAPAPGQPSAPMSTPPQYPGNGQIAPMPNFNAQPPQNSAPPASPATNMQPAAAPAASQDQPGNLYQQSASVLKSIADEIRNNNPGIDNLTLATAVGKRLDMLKEIDPETKAIAAMQVQLLRAQLTYQTQMMRAQTAQEAQQSLAQYHEAIAGIQSQNADTRARELSDKEQGVIGSGSGSGGGKNAIDKEADRISRERIALQNRREKLMADHGRIMASMLSAKDKVGEINNWKNESAELDREETDLRNREQDLAEKQSKRNVELPEGGAISSQKKLPPKVGTRKARPSDNTVWEYQADGKWHRVQ